MDNVLHHHNPWCQKVNSEFNIFKECLSFKVLENTTEVHRQTTARSLTRKISNGDIEKIENIPREEK